MVNNWFEQDELDGDDYQVAHRKTHTGGKSKRPFRHDEKRGSRTVTHDGAHRRRDKRNYL